MTLVCGRYEGSDPRVVDAWAMEEVSLGDFVLSGGEPAAIANHCICEPFAVDGHESGWMVEWDPD